MGCTSLAFPLLAAGNQGFDDELAFDSYAICVTKGQDELLISEVPLPNFEAFVLVILGTLKKDDDKCFYEVIQEEGKLVSQGYVLPNIKFKRKEVLE